MHHTLNYVRMKMYAQIWHVHIEYLVKHEGEFVKLDSLNPSQHCCNFQQAEPMGLLSSSLSLMGASGYPV